MTVLVPRLAVVGWAIYATLHWLDARSEASHEARACIIEVEQHTEALKALMAVRDRTDEMIYGDVYDYGSGAVEAVAEVHKIATIALAGDDRRRERR